MKLRIRRLLLLLAVWINASLGCSGSGGHLAPVGGKVTLDGEPLEGATVTFSPTTVSGPGPFTGVTDAEGRFSLGPMGMPGAGAVTGTYSLVIATVKPDPSGQELAPQQREVVPKSFRDASQRVEVPERGKTDFVFDMKSR